MNIWKECVCNWRDAPSKKQLTSDWHKPSSLHPYCKRGLVSSSSPLLPPPNNQPSFSVCVLVVKRRRREVWGVLSEALKFINRTIAYVVEKVVEEKNVCPLIKQIPNVLYFFLHHEIHFTAIGHITNHKSKTQFNPCWLIKLKNSEFLHVIKF